VQRDAPGRATMSGLGGVPMATVQRAPHATEVCKPPSGWAQVQKLSYSRELLLPAPLSTRLTTVAQGS
jgi:hypothetical protein